MRAIEATFNEPAFFKSTIERRSEGCALDFWIPTNTAGVTSRISSIVRLPSRGFSICKPRVSTVLHAQLFSIWKKIVSWTNGRWRETTVCLVAVMFEQMVIWLREGLMSKVWPSGHKRNDFYIMFVYLILWKNPCLSNIV